MRTMITRGLGALLVMLGGVTPLHAESEDAKALAELAKPGRVLMLRHALAPGFGDPPEFKIGDCATQRNLDAVGRRQARLLGARMRAAGIHKARVYSSQWCRCLETAHLLEFGKATPLPALNSFFGRSEKRAPQLAAVGELLAQLPQDGAPVVLVTHQVVISGITDRAVGSGGGYVLRLNGSRKPPVVATLTVD